MPNNARTVTGSHGNVINYYRFGSGPRLLTCLHSLALDGSWYEPLSRELGEEYTLLAPDFRGHGRSEHGPVPPSLGLVAQDVAAMWDQEGIDCSVVLGISLGGMVAQAVTGLYPERVPAQILMATRGTYDDAAASATLARAAEVRSPEKMREVADPTMYRWFGERSEHDGDPMVEKARAQFLEAGPTVAEYFETMITVGDYVLAEPPPTLVVAGDTDASSPRPVVEQLAKSIPGAQFTLARGGHLVAFENPEEVAATVRPFLDGLTLWNR